MELTYSSYLHLDHLLGLQEPRSSPPEHDEQLFIVIHQTYELWFKLLLHEFEKIGRDFETGELWGAIHTFKRARTVMKTLVGQLDILETMTPTSFSSFRSRLDTASGFQSTQFRELEFFLGYKRPNVLGYFKPETPGLDRLRRRLDEPSLLDRFWNFLQGRGLDLAREIQPQLIDLYKANPDLVILFELMTDFDEGLQEGRYRHVKLAERTIGDKSGTGGSTGVEFLKKTLFHPVFPDLWAIRRHL